MVIESDPLSTRTVINNSKKSFVDHEENDRTVCCKLTAAHCKWFYKRCTHFGMMPVTIDRSYISLDSKLNQGK